MKQTTIKYPDGLPQSLKLSDKDVLDDLEARRWARKLGIEVVGTLGLLLAAKLRGEILSLRESIESLRSLGFRASEPLIAALREQAVEPTS